MANPGDKPKIARTSVVRLEAIHLISTNLEEKLIVSQMINLTAIQLPYVEKPSGYSFFAHEIVPIPKSWAAKTCNLVSYNQHENGGHFAVR